MLTALPLVPLLPFAGFLICGLFGRRLPKAAAGAIASGAVGLSFLVSVGAVRELAGMAEPRFVANLWEWLPATASGAGVFAAPFALALDPLSAVMILVVSGVGFLIHVYSTGYMAEDPGNSRYFAYLNLFTAMMLVLVLGANFLVLFVGWEGVGLCSYLLIGFWFSDSAKADAGRKAFLVNRIGDFGFLLGMLALVAALGTLDFGAVMHAAGEGALGPAGSALPTLIALLLFVGATGKSAQIPLYVWLPDAMAGPTPVSALIHAATMVTAGVYMIVRCAPLYLLAPAAMGVIAVTGAATALVAATIGLAQTDIKKVLAYSTVSQLGLMMLGAGVGAFAAAIFHLFTHAFFKALLFLGSGSVIHAMGGEQDMRRMGGLRAHMPVTFATFVVGAVAIAGIPPLAGFFSKDEILAGVWGSGHPGLWAAGLAVSLCTAFYMFRLVSMTFLGSFRGTAAQAHHLHESPRSMTVPLAALAVASALAGFLGVPAALGGANRFEAWLAPVLEDHASGEAAGAEAGEGHPGGAHEGGAAIGLMAVATLAGLAGAGGALAFYRPGSTAPAAAAAAAAAAGPVYRLVAAKYYVDELYDATVLRAWRAGCAFFDGFDRLIVDGTVNLAASVSQGASQVLRLFQGGLVRGYALLFLFGTAAILWYLLK